MAISVDGLYTSFDGYITSIFFTHCGTGQPRRFSPLDGKLKVLSICPDKALILHFSQVVFGGNDISREYFPGQAFTTGS